MGTLGCVGHENDSAWWLALVYGGLVRGGTCGYVWVHMGVDGCVGHGNDSAWWLALVYGGLVRGGTCGYVWVHMGVYGIRRVRGAWE
jgi:hypothetical protein